MADAAHAAIQDAWGRLAGSAQALRALESGYLDQANASVAERLAALEAQRVDALSQAAASHADRVSTIARDVDTKLASVGEQLATLVETYPRALAAWDDPVWARTSTDHPPVAALPLTGVRLGTLKAQIDGMLPLPAIVPLGAQPLVITASPRCEAPARRLLETVLLRLVLMLPPGRLHLTLGDPIGHGSHLNAFLRVPAQDRTEKVLWSPEDLERRIEALGAELEDVIQRRLGNVHSTITDYNAASPGQPVPYRVLALLDFPAGFTERALARLGLLLQVGPRAGLVPLIHYNPKIALPERADRAILKQLSPVIRLEQDGSAHWQGSQTGTVPVVPDPLPEPERINAWLDALATAREQAAGQVSIAEVRPPVATRWRGSTLDGLRVPVGITERGDPLWFTLGHGRGQHALIGGDTQQGKTTLLHVLITQLALTYAPEELVLYLLDFKGPEFLPYLTAPLPHARAVALKSDPEFGLSVLRRFQQEIDRRDRLFRGAGVARLDDYRRRTGDALPRAVAILDEVHVLFENERWATDGEAARVLEDVAKRGAGFGVHLVLATQSPASGGLRAALGPVYEQMGFRIALRTREAQVGEAILGEGNRGSVDLTAPGMVIANDEGGRSARNVRGRVANLPIEDRETALSEVCMLATGGTFPAPASFDGDEPARLADCRLLQEALVTPTWPELQEIPVAWLGEPVAMSPSLAVPFERYPGANLLIAGEEVGAHGLLAAAILSLAVQLAPEALAFDVVDFARPASAVFGVLGRIVQGIPHAAPVHGPRTAMAALEALDAELTRRQTAEDAAGPRRMLVIAGVHRWRDLQLGGYQPGPAAKQLLRLLDEGPDWGMHAIAWVDGVPRGSPLIRLFDLRTAFLLTEDESNEVFDNRMVATRLRSGRALYRQTDWASGRFELFKPFLLPDDAGLAAIHEALRRKRGEA